MANIDNELQTIATAVYGSEMRSAIHDAIEKVNDDIPSPTISTEIVTASTANNEYTTYANFFKKGGTVICEFNIVVMQGRSGYDPSVTDNGIVLLTLPSGFIPAHNIHATLSGSYDTILNQPRLELLANSDTVKIYDSFSEIIGDQQTFLVTFTYFALEAAPTA